MKQIYLTQFFLLLLLSLPSFAQPDANYINKLTGDLDQQWLSSVGNNIPTNTLAWKVKQVHGFTNTADDARQQALLSQPWNFYPVNTDFTISAGQEVTIPHSFDKKRNYNSAWYVTKVALDKLGNQRCILKLNRVNMFSLVMVNGQRLGYHFGAFTPFQYDITETLVVGDNTIAILVYDQSASVDGDKLYNQISTTRLSYSGGQGFKLSGGMDDVPRLELQQAIAVNDVFVKTSTRQGEMEIEYDISVNSTLSPKAKITFELLKWPNGEKVDLEIPEQSAVAGSHSVKVKWANPELWSPDLPNLYVLRATLKNKKSTDVLDTRFGFREFWVEGKSFMLNGSPIRLRGESHYHPMCYGVDFHREVFNLHKQLFDINACRVHAFMPPGDIMMGADEAGILIVDQSAVWSLNGMFYANGGPWLLDNLAIEYEEWVKRDRNCPSVVIWDVENEMLRFDYDLHLDWISNLRGMVEKYDDTRPLNYSGAGWFSDNQDMVSLHMQDHYTRIMSDWQEQGTKPLIMGEFWVGGRASQRLPHAPEIATAHQRKVEEARIYERNILEMRYKGVSGMMPFRISLLTLFQKPHTTLGYDFTAPDKLEKAYESDDIIHLIRHTMQSVTGFFWPRHTYTSAAEPFQRELVICNDGEEAGEFDVTWKWKNGKAQTQTIALQPTEQRKITINDAPLQNSSQLIALVSQNGDVISTDTLQINSIPVPKETTVKPIQVYKDEKLAATFNALGYSASSSVEMPSVKDEVLWIIPEHANNRELTGLKSEIFDYLNNGGHILCLKQDQTPSWFPVKLHFWSANLTPLHTYKKMGWNGLNRDLRFAKEATIYAPSHPLFSGISSSSLLLWDNFDGRVSDDVYARPSIINKYEQGNWIPLSGGCIRSHVSMAELFYGKGTLLACQLHLMENLDNAQAKVLLTNMLDYLSNKTPEALNHKIVLNGHVTAAELEDMTGAEQASFTGASLKNGDVMLAFDGADIPTLKAWAKEGGQVIVLSETVADAFADVEISNESASYLATKVSDNALLRGVSSANFIGGHSIQSYFTKLPDNATVLLQGFKGEGDFWRIEDAGPVMASLPFGNGEIILSTLNVKDDSSATTRELMALLLTNCGVTLPYRQAVLNDIMIKKSVAINVDGELNEWLDDMDDRLVSPYIHAQPVYLTSQDRIAGPSGYDLNLSAINYFMWNKAGLHVAGVVFTERKSALSIIIPDDAKSYNYQLRYNNDVIDIAFANKESKVSVNNQIQNSLVCGTGQIDSKDMTDATKLEFRYISGDGSMNMAKNLVGETFELIIPWELLESKASDKTAKTLITIQSHDSKLQVPLSAKSTTQENWLNMKVSTKDK